MSIPAFKIEDDDDDDDELASRHQITPRREIQQLNLRHVRMQRHLRDASVFDVEMICLGQRQFEQDGQDHTDYSAMAEYRDVLTAMLRDDFAQARLHAPAESRTALAIGHSLVMNLIQPLVRAEFE